MKHLIIYILILTSCAVNTIDGETDASLDLIVDQNNNKTDQPIDSNLIDQNNSNDNTFATPFDAILTDHDIINDFAIENDLSIDATIPLDYSHIDLIQTNDQIMITDQNIDQSSIIIDQASTCEKMLRTTCKMHLTANCTHNGVYDIQPTGLTNFSAYCNMEEDGGGWVLAYSNANNWASTDASDITSIIWFNIRVYRWYDSKWTLKAIADPNRLGKIWNESEPLLPEHVGAINIRNLYRAGLTDIRFEFIRGSDLAKRSGWCRTDGSWNFSVSNTQQYRCQTVSNNLLCLSGRQKCDDVTWSPGWTNSITLGTSLWDYSCQSAPNTLSPDDGSKLGYMISGFDQAGPLNINAVDRDYQVRIWVREP